MTNNVVALKSGGTIAGIVPQSIEEVFRLAKGIADSGLAPSTMGTAEKITVAILTGLEIGLPPMFALQKIAVVNGRPALWGDALPALLWSRGFKLREWTSGTGDTLTGHCEVTRPDGTKIERSFSVADATKAGLIKKIGPWQDYRHRMVVMRARGFACRDGAADVLGGLYVAEELEDQPRDITPAIEQLAIPDIPDDSAPTVGAAANDEPEPLADPDGYVAKLADDISFCTSAEELAEVAEFNADMIARLPSGLRKKATAMLSEATE